MTNNLTIINNNGQWGVDSREVAVVIEKRHDHLLRDIKAYADVLNGNPTLGNENFFIESTFENRGKLYPCYLLTKKGCDIVGNKMTGEKGILFTATYVSKFDEMEKQIKVLPNNKDSYMIENPIERDKRWIEEETEKLLLEAKVQEQQPKVDYYDRVLDSSRLITITEIAKGEGMSAKQLNKILEQKGIQFKKGKIWFLYSEYDWLISEGYAYYQINEYRQTLKWTEKGRQWIINDVLDD